MSPSLLRWIAALVILSPQSWLDGSERVRTVAPPSAAETVVLDGNAFAWDLYRRVSRTPGNVCLCPYGVRQSLAALAAGAERKTARELARALRLSLPGKLLHPTMGELRRSLLADGSVQGDDAPVLRIATGVWSSPELSVRPEYRELSKTHHGVTWATADFFAAPEAAREAIRTFVEERTDGRVRDLVPDELPQGLTALLLVHATYFRGTWQSEFEESATREAPFHLSARESVNVPLMPQEETLPYGERASFHVVELPYKGGGAGDGSFSMVIVLPKERHGLPRLEASLRLDDLQSVLSGLRPRKVRLWIPRFRVESDVDLRRELHDLGVRRAFRGQGSPFANLTSDAVYLDSVCQRARVSVDEKGTEAAAVVQECVVFYGASTPAVVRADHPFLFLIRHRKTGTILFLGRVADPRE